MVAGDLIRVTEDSLKVADLIRDPPPDVPWRPVLRQVSKWAFGLLPERLRRAYEVNWSPRREFELRGSLFTLRLIRPAIPAYFREVLPSRQAARRVALSGS
jgi:uncharacterized protein (DUF2236 family)